MNSHIDKPPASKLDIAALKGLNESAGTNYCGNNWNDVLQALNRLQAEKPAALNKAGENLIRRMAEAVGDPYTALLDRSDMEKDKLASTSGAFTGIGVELAYKGGLTVVAAIPGSPAFKAGLKSADFITSVDGTPTKGMSFYRAGDLLSGAPNSVCRLQVVRGGKQLSFSIIRQKLSLPGVQHKMAAPGVGFIKVGYFSPHTASEVAQALNNLKSQGIKSLILDLRGNPGGDLAQGLQTAALFHQGQLITKVTREGAKRQVNSYPPAFSGRIAVLIDKGSASSAEIVAQSLKGDKNVRLVGQRSFGKAVIQSLYSLPGGYGIRITTGKYLGRDGKSLHVVGLQPDVSLAENVDSYAHALKLLSK